MIYDKDQTPNGHEDIKKEDLETENVSDEIYVSQSDNGHEHESKKDEEDEEDEGKQE
ncbi:MAG: hypothetical protein DSM106950_28810 [Stigonema ocellatum SAG 48.90 = DSM 106950]|nr:hypothetical protein [Stigonema ocellatum SAG 48.90 = DSM 106950]